MDDKTKLADRREESAAIQVANDLYLEHDEHSPAATAEYRLRLERLEQVRKDMKELPEPLLLKIDHFLDWSCIVPETLFTVRVNHRQKSNRCPVLTYRAAARRCTSEFNSSQVAREELAAPSLPCV
jgi:hypothetical protein